MTHTHIHTDTHTSYNLYINYSMLISKFDILCSSAFSHTHKQTCMHVCAHETSRKALIRDFR